MAAQSGRRGTAASSSEQSSGAKHSRPGNLSSSSAEFETEAEVAERNFARSAAAGPGGSADELEAASRKRRSQYQEQSGATTDESRAEPINEAAGRSLDLKSLANVRLTDGGPYCSEGLIRVFLAAAGRQAIENDSTLLVRMEDTAEAIFSGQLGDTFLDQWRVRTKIDRSVASGPRPAQQARDVERLFDEGGIVLRWDVVEVLVEAAKVRASISNGGPIDPLDTTHFLAATLRSPVGQMGLAELGLLDGGIEPLTRAASGALLERGKQWLGVAQELERQAPLIPLSDDIGASFDSDRAERPAVDPLGFAEDAVALSKLILLRAARPPLAIGLFGAWGSGKSTLMRELQYRIDADLKQERLLRRHGAADHNPDTERVSNVVQIEFNAWAYADSQNLWASLTSEIFDQLAAGGLRQDPGNRVDRRYESLVQEVKLRSSREATAITSSDHEIAALEQRIGIAGEALRRAAEDRKLAATDAAIQTARQLLQGEPPKKVDKVYVSFGEPPKPKDLEVAEVFRGALGSDASLEQRVKNYADAAGDIVRFRRVVWDYVRNRPRALLGGFSCLIAGILFFFVARSITHAAAGIAAKGFAATIAAAALFWLTKVILPAIRFAALLNSQLRERRAAAAVAETEARGTLVQLQRELEQAQIARRATECWVQKYGQAASGTNAASPAMMLEYLVTGSADVELLKAQLGVVATVRRCFEQLDAILKRMRSDGKDGAIDRIILYIDDLDRCTPDQVSQVLQAVHLLLAFECFVVIVAVDARWLKQSLESSQAQLKVSPDGPFEHVATAADYLEKIFQIAFWVRPLVDEDAPEDARYAGYTGLVRSLAMPSVRAPSGLLPATEDDSVQTSADGSADPTRLRWTGPPRLDLLDAPRRRGLELSEAEVLMMEQLAPLAAKSPRAVKRMINLYRLMRVRYSAAQLGLFLGKGGEGVPSYRELLFALAVETGLSSASRQSLRSYVSQGTPDDWNPTKLEGLFEPKDRPALKAVLPVLTGINIKGLLTAVEEVRRFSFLA